MLVNGQETVVSVSMMEKCLNICLRIFKASVYAQIFSKDQNVFAYQKLE